MRLVLDASGRELGMYDYGVLHDDHDILVWSFSVSRVTLLFFLFHGGMGMESVGGRTRGIYTASILVNIHIPYIISITLHIQG